MKFTDIDGSKWEAKVRARYTKTLRTSQDLLTAKQAHAIDAECRGHKAWAEAIRKQTIIRWAIDSGIFTWKRRIAEIP